MSESNEVFWADAETIKAITDQAKSLKDQASRAGLHIEVYLPPVLATWILGLVIEGRFRDPSEAAFVIMTQAKELDLHEDLKSELFNRSSDESPKGGLIPAEEIFAKLKPLSENASEEPPAVWKPVHRLEVLNAALELTNGDSDQAKKWMNTPLEILGNKTPAEYVSNEEELTNLKILIGRLKHGVFS